MKLADLQPRKVTGFRNRGNGEAPRDLEEALAWQNECARTRGYRKREIPTPAPQGARTIAPMGRRAAGGRHRSFKDGGLSEQLLKLLAVRSMTVPQLILECGVKGPYVSRYLANLAAGGYVRLTDRVDEDFEGKGRKPRYWERL